MKNTYLLIFISCLVLGCVSSESEEIRLITAGKDAVNMCISKAYDLDSEALVDEVDRASVFYFDNEYSVIFSIGSPDIFKENEKNYRAVLTCHIVKDPPRHVIDYLAYVGRPPMVGGDGGEIDNNEVAFAAALYIKGSLGDFKYKNLKMGIFE